MEVPCSKESGAAFVTDNTMGPVDLGLRQPWCHSSTSTPLASGFGSCKKTQISFKEKGEEIIKRKPLFQLLSCCAPSSLFSVLLSAPSRHGEICILM